MNPVEKDTKLIEVVIGLESLLSVYVNVPVAASGEPDLDAAIKQAIPSARSVFINWLLDGSNDPHFEVCEVTEVEEG